MDYRRGKKLGKYDRLVNWKRLAARRKPHSLQQWKALPEELELRITRIFVKVKGFRVQQYDPVTTLTDAEGYTVEQLAQMYFHH